jgi:hypothetical protein
LIFLAGLGALTALICAKRYFIQSRKKRQSKRYHTLEVRLFKLLRETALEIKQLDATKK